MTGEIFPVAINFSHRRAKNFNRGITLHFTGNLIEEMGIASDSGFVRIFLSGFVHISPILYAFAWICTHLCVFVCICLDSLYFPSQQNSIL